DSRDLVDRVLRRFADDRCPEVRARHTRIRRRRAPPRTGHGAPIRAGASGFAARLLGINHLSGFRIDDPKVNRDYRFVGSLCVGDTAADSAEISRKRPRHTTRAVFLRGVIPAEDYDVAHQHGVRARDLPDLGLRTLFDAVGRAKVLFRHYGLDFLALQQDDLIGMGHLYRQHGTDALADVDIVIEHRGDLRPDCRVVERLHGKTPFAGAAHRAHAGWSGTLGSTRGGHR